MSSTYKPHAWGAVVCHHRARFALGTHARDTITCRAVLAVVVCAKCCQLSVCVRACVRDVEHAPVRYTRTTGTLARMYLARQHVSSSTPRCADNAILCLNK